MLRNAVRKIRFNGNRICQRLEHSHNSPKVEKAEDITKIMKELEIMNKNINAMHNDIKVMKLQKEEDDSTLSAIIIIGGGCLIGAGFLT